MKIDEVCDRPLETFASLDKHAGTA